MPDKPVIILTAVKNGCAQLQDLLTLNGYIAGNEIFYPLFRTDIELHVLADWAKFQRKDLNTCFIVHYIHLEKYFLKKSAEQKKEILDSFFAPCDYIYLQRDSISAAIAWQFTQAKLMIKHKDPKLAETPLEEIRIGHVPYDYNKIISEYKAQHRFHNNWEEVVDLLGAYRLSFTELKGDTDNIAKKLCEFLQIPFISSLNLGSGEKSTVLEKEMTARFITDFRERNMIDPRETEFWQVALAS